MLKTWFPIFCVVMLGCKKPTTNNNTQVPDANSELTTINIMVDNLSRSFLLYKPKGYNNAGKLPVVFVSHGGSGNSQGMLSLTDFRPIADREKVLLIYPQGSQNSWNDGRPTDANVAGVDDVNFFRQMCNYAVSNLSADAARIYATGISNGGFMSARLGCQLSDKIAAIAVVAASMEQGVYNNCNPGNSVPSIFIHGTADIFVPFIGGTVSPGAGGTAVSHAQAVSKWNTLNNCSTSPVTTNIADSANDGTTITKREYNNTTNNTQVVSYVVTNGGHTWPQGLQYLSVAIIGKTTQNLNANENIWAFFKKYRRG
jgi:polyhydroxybutyrate depolymerase